MNNGFETTAKFTCPKCKRFVSSTVEIPEPSWSAELASDNTSEGPTEVVCPKCETVFCASCFNSLGSCDITLDDYPDTSVDADLAQYSSDGDNWSDYEAPANPEDIFFDSYHYATELLAEHGGEGTHLVNRMIFVQQVSALEAYLADTLINIVAADEEAMARLLASDRDLSSKKFTLAEIASNTAIVEIEAFAYLRSIIYHNIPKVRSLYKIAARVDLFELLGADKDRLFKAIEYRHDCVHRNGRDSKGSWLDVFTKAYVQETADLMKALVVGVESKIYQSQSISTESIEDLF